MGKTDIPKSTPKKNKESKSRPFNQYSQYLKYSGLAIQMAVLVAIGYLIGKKLDNWFHTGYPIFMITMIFLFLFAAIYSIIKNLPKD